LDNGDIPTLSRFMEALRRIAFFRESSSVAAEPSAATACLPLRRTTEEESGTDRGASGGEWHLTSFEKDSSAFARGSNGDVVTAPACGEERVPKLGDDEVGDDA
jgi:hypothetical protein